jgi:hypothetical protein
MLVFGALFFTCNRIKIKKRLFKKQSVLYFKLHLEYQNAHALNNLVGLWLNNGFDYICYKCKNKFDYLNNYFYHERKI